MEAKECLNCKLELRGNYCYGCGQKASTHRLSMKHFLQHDLLHGIWHLDKGILFTIRHIFIHPGLIAKNYIAGKRAGHFNLITLLVLLSGLFLLTVDMKPFEERNTLRINGREASVIVHFIANYIKWLLLLAVPLLAVASLRTYKRLTYNLTEHLVMNSFFTAGVLLIFLFFRVFYLIPGASAIVFFAEAGAVLFYLGYAYMQVGSDLYKPARNFFLYCLTILLFVINVIFVVGLVSMIYVILKPK